MTARPTRTHATAAQPRPSPAVRREVVIDDDATARPTARPAPATPDELLRRRDFADCTPEELAHLRRDRRRDAGRPSDACRVVATDATTWSTPSIGAPRSGTPAAPVGDPVELRMRRPTERRRRVVLIADVSGSMEAYSRAYLYLLHGCGAGAARRDVRVRDAAHAADAAAACAYRRSRAGARAPRWPTIEDWSGGTRIGDVAQRVQRPLGPARPRPRGGGRDRVRRLGERRHRRARAADGAAAANGALRRSGSTRVPSAPTTSRSSGGMAAALPFVDHFASGHSLEALDDVIRAISVTSRSAR